MSISPIKDLPIFKYRCSDQSGTDIYQLDDKKLSNDECHMFYCLETVEETMIAMTLEFLTFNPKDIKMNKKFNVNVVVCGKIELCWCSFPKEFKDVCQRIAATFKMELQYGSGTLTIRKDPPKLLEGSKKKQDTLKKSLYQHIHPQIPQQKLKDPIKKNALARIVNKGSAIILQFEAAENVLFFDGERCNNSKFLEKQYKNIVWFGNDLYRLDID